MSLSIPTVGCTTSNSSLLLARATDRRSGWARSPAVVLQLLALPVGIGLLQGGVWAAGVPVLLLAAGTLSQLAMSGAASAAES